MTFSRVSVAAYTTEPDHFYVNITETWSCMFPPRFRNTETCDFVLCVGPVSFLFSEMINRDVKEPTHFSQRVGNVAPGVALWPCHGIHKPTFKPVLVSTRFLQTLFFKQDHFHLDFHLSLEKACLRNFINFLKWREWFLYWKLIWNLQKVTFTLVTSPISYDCVKDHYVC